MELLSAQARSSAQGFLLASVSAILAVVLILAGHSAFAQPAASKEFQVKAVFLFNFAQFVEWPTSAFADEQKPLIIGVLGEDPFGPYLDDTVRGEKVNGRPLAVERYHKIEEVKTCHILFVSHSETAHLKQDLEVLKSRPILTVSDINDFCRQGGTIQFVTDKNKIRLKINVEAARAAHLTISSKLLRPAEIVSTGGK